MKKLSLTSLFLSLSALTAAADDVTPVSLFPTDEPIYAYDGLKTTEDEHIGIAVRIPRKTLDLYQGCQVVGLELGWSSPEVAGNVEAFLKSSLPGENLATASGELTHNMSDPYFEAGWNRVDFSEPIDLSAFTGDLYMGFYADTKAGVNCIPVSMYGKKIEDSLYISRFINGSEGAWEDISGEYGPAAMRLLITGGDISKSQNLADLEYITSQSLQIPGLAYDARLSVSNPGSNDISSLKLVYTFGDSSRDFDITLSRPIQAGASGQSVFVPIYALGTGTHTLTIAQVNGVDNTRDNRSMTYDMVAVPQEVADRYAHRPLIELFVSENDYNSAKYYDDIFLPGYEPLSDRMSVVCHHMGDQFMTGDDEDTQILIDFANGDKSKVYVPVITVDRGLYTPRISAAVWTDTPPVWIIMPTFAEAFYQPALDTPAFASVNVSTSLGSNNDKIEVTVSGTIENDILPDGEDLHLTVYALENDVISDSQEMPDDDEFTSRYPDGLYPQQNVIRLQPTPIYGDKVGNGGDYTKSYTMDLYEGCNPSNMRIVAFLNRPSTNDRRSRNVINCAEAPINTVGIEAVNADDVDIRIIDGVLHVEGAEGPVSVIAPDGRLVNRTGLVPGLYIVSVSTPTGVVSRKIIVK